MLLNPAASADNIYIYIYILLTPAGKKYVCSKNNANASWQSHITGDVDSPWHQAIQLNGADVFKFEIIEQAEHVDPD